MTVTRFRLASTVFISALSINSAMALPIDWTGVFGVDTTMISNLRRTKDSITAAQKPDATAGTPRTGTQGIRNGDSGANFQTYVFKLNPTIIVNDGVTLKGELSSGYLRGGFAGDNAANNQQTSANNSGAANNSYFFTTPAQRSALNVNQMYMELYADTALVKIGRMSKHYGLGIVWDNGNDSWDRFLTMYDGIEATMKIGNFSLVPYYSKISSYNNNSATGTVGSQPAGGWDVRELGMSAQYDNKNRDLVVSIQYAKRSSERKATLYSSNSTTATGIERGKTSVTVIEPYVSKKWNKFKIAFEGSLQSGDYGNVYSDGTGNSKLSTTAYVLESKYEFNPKWDMGLNAGQANGDKGSSQKFEAAYLHPNYHIAELMFRYNYASFNEGGRSIFDASVNNTRFYKLFGNYKSDKWTWKSAFIMANAMESAKAGPRAYHHEENYSFTSSQKQSKDMGYEIDLGFDYRWNPNVTITGSYGYWFVGDYYAFTNTAEELSISNVHGGSLRATLEF